MHTCAREAEGKDAEPPAEVPPPALSEGEPDLIVELSLIRPIQVEVISIREELGGLISSAPGQGES